MVQATRKRAEHLGPARRRPEILDGALQLFLEHGYEGTSMQAVADRSGVTKPVIYTAFESKDTLFRALLEREEQRIMSDI
ncbi:MAG: TetR/AcrR family transcriptional regulator, partial [Solirubrobacterales bacterium]